MADSSGTEALQQSAGSFAEQIKTLPIGDMVRDIAMGVAKAQAELDMSSLKMLREYSKKNIDLYGDGSKQVSLLELGFSPHFLFFQKVNIRVHMEMSFHTAQESSKNFSVNANLGYESNKTTQSNTTPAGGGGGGAMTPAPDLQDVKDMQNQGTN